MESQVIPQLPGLIIREAQLDDLVSIMNIETQVFAHDAYSQDMMEDLIRGRDESITLVAELAGWVVGYGVVMIRDLQSTLFYNVEPAKNSGIRLEDVQHVGYLKSMAVIDDPLIRRKGVGTKIVQVRLQWLQKRNIEHVFVYAMSKGDAPALFRKLSWTEIRGWSEKKYADSSYAILFYKNIKTQLERE